MMEKTEKTPKVSVCVVTYNQEKYIRQCLQSIVNQKTDFSFEIIVGDDCSTDKTRAYVQELSNMYPQIIKPIFHEKNIGPADNYFAVHKVAIGDYIAHIDGDDYMMPEKLAKQASYLDNNLDCVAVVHKLALVDSNGNSLSNFWPNKFLLQKFDLTKLVETHPAFGHSSLMYRSQALQLLIENAPPKIIDFYVYIHLASQGKIGVIDQVFGTNTAGIGISANNNLYESAIQALCYGSQFTLSSEVLQFAKARQYLLFAKKALVENNLNLFVELISLSTGQKIISLQQRFLYAIRKKWMLLKIISLAITTRTNARKIFTQIN